jgi:N-acetylmuramoyl-L-alanine amidase
MGGRTDEGLVRRWRAVAAAAVFALGAACSSLAAAAEGVLKVRTGGDGASARIVLELDRSASGKVATTDAETVIVTLPGVGVAGVHAGKGTGLVRAWRVREGAGGARLEIEVARSAVVKRRFLLPPGDGVEVYRYVVDLEARPGGTQVAVVGRPTRVAGADGSAVPVKARATRPDKRVIVIDPGHGGKDPGAVGLTGVREKDVNLAAAKALKARLERQGEFRVVLTRETDVYLPLSTRVRIARKADADLFISLHADAGSPRSLRGASVYTLSEKGSERAARQATRSEDWVKDLGLGGSDLTVNRILLDLTQRATRNRSARFATVLLENIGDKTPLLRRSHRSAGFEVLLAPDVPAVLLEMGFMTNPEDEKLLTDAKRRGRLMDGVAEAIDDYFKTADTRYASVTGAT